MMMCLLIWCMDHKGNPLLNMRHPSNDGLPCKDKSYTVGIAMKTDMACTFAPNLEGMLETTKGEDQQGK